MSLRHIINTLAVRSCAKYDRKPLSYFTQMIESETPFSFSRFGDGEWHAIFEDKGSNCDGHEYFPELSKGLKETLTSSLPYHYGLMPRAIKMMGKRIRTFITDNNIEIPWVNSNVFHDANIQGRLYPLVKALRDTRLVIIGPKHLKGLTNLFGEYEFVECPEENCFLKTDSMLESIRPLTEPKEPTVFGFSASMAANIMIHDLYNESANRHSFIDFGALWDVYAGVESRAIYRKEDWKRLIDLNLGTA